MSFGGEGLNYFFFYKNKVYLLRGTDTDINKNIFSTFKFIPLEK
jgi:hypothetical protein